MKDSLCGKISSVKKASFYRKNSEISPSEIFKELYSPLEELIAFNRRNELKPPRKNFSQYDPNIKSEFDPEKIENIRDTIRKIRFPYLVKIETEDGKKVDCKIEPRTNFNNSLLKTPNIVYLSFGGDSPLILRGALDRDEEEVFEKHARKFFGSKYKGKLDSSSKMGHSDVYFIPEPKLLLGLEGIYSRGISHRITPEIRIVESNENNFWYLRKFLPSLRDSSITESHLGRYHGIFNGLGLIDVMDDQIEHYCVRDGKVIHIDPDYITYSTNPGFGNQTDLSELKKNFFNFFSGAGGIRLKEKRQEEIRSVAEKFGRNKFHEYVPNKLKESPFLNELMVQY